MFTITPSEVPTATLHSYLLTAVSPRPIAFASTIDSKGNPNLSPFSFFNVFSANPPILIFSPARRVKNNTTKHTLENVLETKEVVINMVNHSIVQQMSLSSTEYPEGTNEFEKAGLTMLGSELIKPFRVAEAPVQLECKVNEVISLGDQGGAGNLVICEVLKMHIDESVLDENKGIDQYKLDLVSRAGGSFYSRAKDGFFEIPKPLRTMGIGVDSLPKEVRNSSVLTGNDLGLLGNTEELPNKETVDKYMQEHPEFIVTDIVKKHTFAKAILSKGKVASALNILLQ